MSHRPSRIRWYFALVFFVIGVIAYMDRSNIAIIAGPMMDDLQMSKTQFGFLASFFSLGYALMQVPSGVLAERFGPRKMLAIALVWWSAFTVLTGVVKNHGLLYTVRFLFGMGEAPLYPANAVFNTYWFGDNEKGRAASALLAGSYFGPVIAPLITVAIYQIFGWEAVFYIFGLVGLLMALLWLVIAKDMPEQHRLVNAAEKQLIADNRGLLATDRKTVPWGRFLGCFSFHAIAAQYFVVQFVIGLFLIWLPTYLTEMYGVTLEQMGLAAGAPWLMMFVFLIAGGALSDRMLARGRSRFAARGSLAIGGFVIFCIALYLALATESLYLNIFWLSLCLGGIGLSMGMSWASAIDIGRNFSGTVSGWMNLWGNIGALLSPILAGVLADQIGWTATLLLVIIPVVFAIIMWFFIKPDQPLIHAQD